MTIANVFTALTTVLGTIWDVFTEAISMVTSNPLVFVPVLLALSVSIVMFVLTIIRKLGVKGIATSGGRRRRRR